MLNSLIIHFVGSLRLSIQLYHLQNIWDFFFLCNFHAFYFFPCVIVPSRIFSTMLVKVVKVEILDLFLILKKHSYLNMVLSIVVCCLFVCFFHLDKGFFFYSEFAERFFFFKSEINGEFCPMLLLYLPWCSFCFSFLVDQHFV